MRDALDRRRVLAGAAVLLAGCGGAPTDDGSDPAADESPTDGSPTDHSRTDGSPDDESPATTSAGSPDGTTGDLDLREANVTGVAVEGGEGAYRFEVTLYHDDDGEDGYADWWQVESLDGERLGRRDLSHAHGTREFTRSANVTVGGHECVVVRGHDQTHGYGGQAMLVTPARGATRAVRQGSDPDSFAGAECP